MVWSWACAKVLQQAKAAKATGERRAIWKVMVESIDGCVFESKDLGNTLDEPGLSPVGEMPDPTLGA
jgi:hypothetical protein